MDGALTQARLWKGSSLSSEQRTRRSLTVSILQRLRARKLARLAKRLQLRRWERSARPQLLTQHKTGRAWESGQWIATQVDPTATVALQAARNYEAVRDALEAHGLHHVVVSAHPMRPYVVAIADEDWPAALTALVASLENTAFYAEMPTRSLRGRKLTDAIHISDESFRRHFLQNPRLSLFRSTQRVAQGAVLGAAHAVRIQRWVTDELGNLSHGGPNDVAAGVDPHLFRQTVKVKNELGIDTIRLDSVPEGRHERCQFPIDVVYMWVDGEDPVWRAQRSKALGQLEASTSTLSADSTGSWLFRDRNELMYSMRSLEEYLPWVRTIHVVTDGQVPKWLDTSHPRVRLHVHHDIFQDPTALPTFNSQAIGSQLHRVPGLSERYLVMNDDILFSAPLEPEHFFTPSGIARVGLSRRRFPAIARENMTAIESSRFNTARLIEQLHGERPTRLFAHTPIPQIKAVQVELESQFAQAFDTTMRSRVRSHSDYELNSWLHLNHLLSVGLGVEIRYAYDYFYLATPRRRRALAATLRARRVAVVCVNDGPTDDGDNYEQWLNDVLQQAFPVPSQMELDPHDWRQSVRLDS